MRLAQAGRAVQEEWVVRVGGQLGHRKRRRVGEVVLLADHELLEGVLRVQVRRRRRLCPRGGGRHVAGRRLTPVGADHLDGGALVEALCRCPAQERDVALGDRRPDVLRRPHVQRPAAHRRELERLDPDMELEVRGLGAELVPDVVPDLVEGFGQGRSGPSPGARSKVYGRGGKRAERRPPLPSARRVYNGPRGARRGYPGALPQNAKKAAWAARPGSIERKSKGDRGSILYPGSSR